MVLRIISICHCTAEAFDLHSWSVHLLFLALIALGMSSVIYTCALHWTILSDWGTRKRFLEGIDPLVNSGVLPHG